jgi:serine/threonine protein kinase
MDHFEKYIGIPEFMAPEVNEGNYNFKADIYS